MIKGCKKIQQGFVTLQNGRVTLQGHVLREVLSKLYPKETQERTWESTETISQRYLTNVLLTLKKKKEKKEIIDVLH